MDETEEIISTKALYYVTWLYEFLDDQFLNFHSVSRIFLKIRKNLDNQSSLIRNGLSPSNCHLYAKEPWIAKIV